ncbi:DUF4288 domain-containing protein [Aquibacillus rhizosphaerae]|uniref:DUF4288 domain-containing protein n=1 Tax=Aquibacillus rhizosphaerae TaxID=3051431 RepID=A0ABT7L7D9_9BACI|nr:DUF4288 domain-containing protein [Aquibacillus sp. LR5S19]MDL4841770.1 DUF4288 domain-containing protein [Aquibacillus sp. LR5S19]
MENKWFVVNLLYKSINSGQQNIPIELKEVDHSEEEVFEERHYLIRTSNRKNAELIGEDIAIKNENKYNNIYGEQVFWKYEKFLECYEVIDELDSGAEIYSRHIISAKGTTTNEIINRFFPED